MASSSALDPSGTTTCAPAASPYGRPAAATAVDGRAPPVRPIRGAAAAGAAPGRRGRRAPRTPAARRAPAALPPASRCATTASRTAGGATNQTDAERRREQLARGAQVHDDVGAECGEQRQRRDVVAQLAVVVVLDDEEALGPCPVHERDPPARRQPRAQRELVRRRAVDGRQPGRAGRRRRARRRRRERIHVESGGPQRLGGALVARLLDGDPRAARQGAGQLGDRRGRSARGEQGPGSAGRPRWRSRCATTASRNAGSPTGSGTTSGGSSAAARQARRQAARSSAATQGVPGRRSTAPALAGAASVGDLAAGPRTPGGTATTNVPAPRRPATHPSASSWS